MGWPLSKTIGSIFRVKIGPIGSETSVRVYHYSLSNGPEQRSSRLRTSPRKQPAVTVCIPLARRKTSSSRSGPASTSASLLLPPDGKSLQSLLSIVSTML